MSSYSSGDGAMALTITFKLGTDLDQAQVLVQNRVSIAEPRLPEEVRRLGITTAKSSPDLMMVVHMLSPDDTYDQLYVSNYARSRVRDVLLRLDGVGDLIIFGEREYSLRIWLDPEKLSAFGMTAGDVVQALRDQNVQVSGGSIGAPPTNTRHRLPVHGHHAGPLRRRARLPLCHRQVDRGRPADLAAGRRPHRARRQGLRHQLLSQRQAGGGARHLPAAGHQRARRGGGNPGERSSELSGGFPEGLAYEIVYNPTEFIAESINEVYKTIVEAILLVVIVIIVFLQSWRMAIVPIVAIPVSLIGTLAVLYAFGFSLNMLTLFGLVLAVGIVVDDAIVVVENVERNIALGLDPTPAAHRTMDEVGTAVIAISLVLIAVFVPTAFIPGISGQFYLQFAITIAVSTAISAFNSLTLSPALAALLFKPHHASQKPPRFCPGALRPRAGRRLQQRLRPRLANGMRASCVMLGRLDDRACWPCSPCSPALIYATVHMLQTVPRGFIPTMDQGYAIVVVQLPDGSSLARTDAVIQKATEIIRKTPGVANAVAFAGFSGATFTNASNAGVIFAPFESFEDRLRDGQTADKIIGSLFGSLQEHPGGLHHRAAAAARAAASAIPAASRCSCRSATAPTCGRSWRLPTRSRARPTRRRA